MTKIHASYRIKHCGCSEYSELTKENEDKDEWTPRCYAGEKIPTLINPKYRSFLASIVNKLDTRSFLNLAKSCKYFYNYCFHTSEIKIICNLPPLSIEYSDQNPSKELTLKHDFLYNNAVSDKFKYVYLLSKTRHRDYPFVFILRELCIVSKKAGVNEHFLTLLRSFLKEFPIRNVKCFKTSNKVELNSLIKFMKDFKVTHLEIESRKSPEKNEREALNYIFENTLSFKCKAIISAELLLKATVPNLVLARMMMSKTLLISLITILADSTADLAWEIGAQPYDFGREDFPYFKVLSFVQKGDRPEKTPIIFFNEQRRNELFLLRNDGEVLHIHRDSDVVKFYRIKHSGLYPYCLRPVYPTIYRRDLDESGFLQDSDNDSTDSFDAYS